MTKLEKMAYDWKAKNPKLDPDPSYLYSGLMVHSFAYEAFIAGFKACRAMALDECEEYLKYDSIRELGEEEV